MNVEIFKTERDFNNKFPSKFYVCCNCHRLIQDKYTCNYCGWRADGLLKTWGKGYKYTILETGITEEIFTPIEMEKEKNEQTRHY